MNLSRAKFRRKDHSKCLSILWVKLYFSLNVLNKCLHCLCEKNVRVNLWNCIKFKTFQCVVSSLWLVEVSSLLLTKSFTHPNGSPSFTFWPLDMKNLNEMNTNLIELNILSMRFETFVCSLFWHRFMWNMQNFKSLILIAHNCFCWY